MTTLIKGLRSILAPTQDEGSERVVGGGRHPTYMYCNSKDAFSLFNKANIETDRIEDIIVQYKKQKNQRIHQDNDVNVEKCSKISHPNIPSAKDVNQTLNLNLGLNINPMDPQIRIKCRRISYFLQMFEEYIFSIWERIPLRIRQKITFFLWWYIYFPIHKLMLGKKTGIHKDASYEYHALTTILYWGRFFPVSIRQMRFTLSQLSVWHPPEAYPPSIPLSLYRNDDNDVISRKKGNLTSHGDSTFRRWITRTSTTPSTLTTTQSSNQSHCSTISSKLRSVSSSLSSSSSATSSPSHPISGVIPHGTCRKDNIPTTEETFISIDGVKALIHEIHYDMIQHPPQIRLNSRPRNDDNEFTVRDSVVTGYYIQHSPYDTSDKVIFWLYGGAFLSGDSKGNLNIAEKFGQRCNYSDVFLPNYRLLPEYDFYDALHDVLQAYEYLIVERNVHPSNIILLGVSSGGGLVMRLLQTLEERKELHSSTVPDYCTISKENDAKIDHDLFSIMPLGAVLMSPFVDYTEPTGSFLEYTSHDLIVNQSVFEVGVPYFERLGDSTIRRQESPVHRSCKGLPPLCIVVSEHECCFDQVVLLCNRARADGVQTDFAVWKYMCHVFPLLSSFVPEGKQAMDFMCAWINLRIQDNRQNMQSC